MVFVGCRPELEPIMPVGCTKYFSDLDEGPPCPAAAYYSQERQSLCPVFTGLWEYSHTKYRSAVIPYLARQELNCVDAYLAALRCPPDRPSCEDPAAIKLRMRAWSPDSCMY